MFAIIIQFAIINFFILIKEYKTSKKNIINLNKYYINSSNIISKNYYQGHENRSHQQSQGYRSDCVDVILDTPGFARR